MALHDIDTIVIAIMENRSFDHMLGYLSLDETPDPPGVDGCGRIRPGAPPSPTASGARAMR